MQTFKKILTDNSIGKSAPSSKITLHCTTFLLLGSRWFFIWDEVCCPPTPRPRRRDKNLNILKRRRRTTKNFYPYCTQNFLPNSSDFRWTQLYFIVASTPPIKIFFTVCNVLFVNFHPNYLQFVIFQVAIDDASTKSLLYHRHEPKYKTWL